MIDKLRKACKAKGYRFFEEGDFNLNIIGVRSDNPIPDKFDDVIYLCYKVDGKWQMHEFKCTTDPGLYWLKNPMQTRGTAILKPGQYRGAYKLGTHRGYKALVQIGGPVTILIDSNRDGKLDFDSKTEESGYFGINIHRASEHHNSTVVDKWSAGCQVIASPDQFEKLLSICDKAATIYGNSFTYTLLEARDL